MNPILCLAICLTGAASDLTPSEMAAHERSIAKIERAARRFRIHAYFEFRLNRAEYDRRIEAGEELLRRVSKVRHASRHEPLVIQWFDNARQNTGAGVDFAEFPLTDDGPNLVGQPPAPPDDGPRGPVKALGIHLFRAVLSTSGIKE